MQSVVEAATISNASRVSRYCSIFRVMENIECSLKLTFPFNRNCCEHVKGVCILDNFYVYVRLAGRLED